MDSASENHARRERERRDLESFGSLEALLLAVMKEKGVVTVDGLYSEMHLSQGSTTRALQRLGQQGLAIRESDLVEAGRKTAYLLTEKGESKLKEMWKSVVARERRSVRDILIAVALAKLLVDPEELKEGTRALRDMAGSLRVQASDLLSKARTQMSRLPRSVAAEFGLWQAIYAAGRIRGEGDALEEIVNLLQAELERKDDDLWDEEGG